MARVDDTSSEPPASGAVAPLPVGGEHGPGAGPGNRASAGGGRKGGGPLAWARAHRAPAIAIACAVVAAIVAVVLVVGSSGGSGDAVYVQRVSDVNIASTGGTATRYAGVVESQDTQKVQFDSSRTLGELRVAEGDHVDKGDVLFTYDTEATQLEVEQGELEIEQKQTNISDNEAQIKSLQSQMASASNAADRLSYSAQIQQLQADVAQATYDVKTKQSEVDRLKAIVADPSVKAEISGVVSKVGDVSALSQGGSGDGSSSGDVTSSAGGGTSGSGDDAFITIIADGDFRVRASVTEQTIGQLSQGEAVVVRSRVDTSKTWKGTISAIESSPQGSSDSSTGYGVEGSDSSTTASSYAFYVTLDATDGLMLGQHVTVEEDLGQGTERKGIWLDGGWIVTEDDGSTYVWATSTDGGRLEHRAVTLGEHDDEGDYQIASGLQETDYLAWPDSSLAEGQATTTAPQLDGGDASGSGVWVEVTTTDSSGSAAWVVDTATTTTDVSTSSVATAEGEG